MFSLSETEKRRLQAWLDGHDTKCKLAARSSQGAIGGRLTYEFTPTGIGTIASISFACGEEIDVTDYDNW